MSDPLFVEELNHKLRTHRLPVAPLPSRLVRKSVPSYLKQGYRRSFFVHGVLLLVFFLQQLLSFFLESPATREARLRAQQAKSAIRVDIVDLPSLKLKDLAQVDATQKVAEKAPTVKEKPQEEKKAPPPSPTAMIDRTQQAKKEKEKAAEEAHERVKRLKSLRESLRADARRRELMQKIKTEGNTTPEGGRPVLAGNILSEGDSVTGDLATLVDAYNGQVKAHLRRHWNVPGWMSTGRLKARVLVKIAPDGRILSQKFLERSGNGEFDGYVKKSLDLSDPFPAPPEHLKRLYMEEGLEWGFPE